jgi:hypothetical protein
MLGHLQASLHDPRSIAIFSVWNLQKTLPSFQPYLEWFLSCYEIEHPMAKDRKECQNLSTQNLFTIARHSSAKNARLGALFNPRLMGNRGGKAKFLHIHHGFVHVFSPYLMPFCGFVSTPKNKKSTPNFFSALTF